MSQNKLMKEICNFSKIKCIIADDNNTREAVVEVGRVCLYLRLIINQMQHDAGKFFVVQYM